MTQSVLFVCLGNICRSPLAEAALRQECANAGLNIIVDSAGTGEWHVGQAPDERAVAVAERNGVDINHLRARQVTASDFRDFNHIIALDNQNLNDLTAIQPAKPGAKLSLLFDHVEGRAGEDVTDPYYGGAEGFDQTWEEVTEAAQTIRGWLEDR
ncbi:MAG: low molecular weight protein-tyrosine-phosphatase [Parasphingorhabdus sp.]|uniref:low molecular weight protein-tyrosine-phosphatase n=2 Tax=Parasphingorhabdus sp. TaxID=2709688 RepID=UPI003266B524